MRLNRPSVSRSLVLETRTCPAEICFPFKNCIQSEVDRETVVEDTYSGGIGQCMQCDFSIRVLKVTVFLENIAAT